MQDLLARAIQLQHAGQSAEAAALCRQLLVHQPDHADALQLLGVLLLQNREPGQALPILSQAAVLKPTAEFLVTLAEAHHAVGQHDPSAVAAREALRLRPDFAEAQRVLERAERGLKQRDQAIDYLRRDASQNRDAGLHARLAGLLRQAGRVDEALEHFQRAAKLAPGDALGHANLGQMLLSLHRAQEALAPCRRAVALQPQTPALHLILGDALRRAEQYAEAQAVYLEALRLQPALARAHANLGLLARAQKQFPDALAHLQRALALEPNNPWFWRYLAEAYFDWDDFSQSIPCWQKAAALEPLQASLRIGLATALMEAGQMDDAEQHLRLAWRLQPDAEEGLIALGDLLQRRDDHAEAEQLFRAAWRPGTSSVRAAVRLARLLASRLPHEDFARIEAQANNRQTSGADRAALQFALANVLDQQGEFLQAADFARQANALNLERMRQRRDYSSSKHHEFVQGLMAAFDADFFARTAGGGVATDRPIFIVGLERSGTTLVEQILASHPRVHGAGELPLGWDSFQAIPSACGQSDDALACVPALDAPALHRLAQQHLAWLDVRTQGQADRIVDKMPANYLYLGLLAAMFPRATFIHCRRDLRDVAVSLWFTQFQWLEWTSDFDHIAARFADYRNLMDHWHAVLPVKLHDVCYEDMVQDLETTARSLIAACGLDWDPACLEFHKNRRPVRTASVFQVRKPIYRGSIGRWRHYETALADLFARLLPG